MPSTPKGSQLVAVTLAPDEIAWLKGKQTRSPGVNSISMKRKLYEALPADA